MIGTNNVGNTKKSADTAAGIEAIVKRFRRGVPGIKVLVLGIFPREEQPCKAREKNTKVNQIISKLADDKSVFYMDIGASFTEADGSLSKKVMPDFLHLSKDGYRRGGLWRSKPRSLNCSSDSPAFSKTPLPRTTQGLCRHGQSSSDA